MAPSHKKKRGDDPRDPRHRRVVLSAGSSPLKSPPLNGGMSCCVEQQYIVAGCSSSSAQTMTVGLRSAEVFVLLDSDDEDKDPHEHDAAFALDPNRVLSAYSRGAELNDVELEKVLMQVRFRIG
jgi:hypothetical protein